MKSLKGGLYMRYDLAEISKNVSSKNLQGNEGKSMTDIFSIREIIIER